MVADPRAFNGTSLTFGSAIAKLVGLQYRANGEVIDVTEPEDAAKMFEIGQADLEVVARVKRMPTVDVGDQDTLSIVWKDGSTTTLSGDWGVTSVDGGGDWNSPISGSITFKPVVADADA
jgi:hypothetical protein